MLKKTIAVLDDASEKDRDLLFTSDGVVQLVKGKLKQDVPYDDILISPDETAIVIHQPYSNSDIDMHQLISALELIRSKPLEVYKRKNPLDLLTKKVKQ